MIPAIIYIAINNVALKDRNKTVKEVTLAAINVDTDYSKPRNRKPPKRLFSSDSESDEPSAKKPVGSHSIPEPSSTLPSNLKRLLDSATAKNLAKSKQKCSAISQFLSASPKKNTTPVCQLLLKESALSGLFFNYWNITTAFSNKSVLTYKVIRNIFLSLKNHLFQ